MASDLAEDEIFPESGIAFTQRQVLRELKRLSSQVLDIVSHGVPSDLERWRGGVDEQLKNIATDMHDLKTSVPRDIDRLGDKVSQALKDAHECGRKEHDALGERVTALDDSLTARVTALENEKVRIGTIIALVAGIGGMIGGGLFSELFKMMLSRMVGG